MADVQIDDRQVTDYLQRLSGRLENMRPVLLEIGELVAESTKHRFVTTTDPSGNAWELNSVLSTLLYKDGDKPLTGETGFLMNTINYQLLGSTGVEIGSPMEYAAMQQFGGTKAEFPSLWGDIPARRFLGLSDDDTRSIIETISDYLI